MWWCRHLQLLRVGSERCDGEHGAGVAGEGLTQRPAAVSHVTPLITCHTVDHMSHAPAAHAGAALGVGLDEGAVAHEVTGGGGGGGEGWRGK
jgi:hypothetical protein